MFYNYEAHCIKEMIEKNSKKHTLGLYSPKKGLQKINLTEITQKYLSEKEITNLRKGDWCLSVGSIKFDSINYLLLPSFKGTNISETKSHYHHVITEIIFDGLNPIGNSYKPFFLVNTSLIPNKFLELFLYKGFRKFNTKEEFGPHKKDEISPEKAMHEKARNISLKFYREFVKFDFEIELRNVLAEAEENFTEKYREEIPPNYCKTVDNIIKKIIKEK